MAVALRFNPAMLVDVVRMRTTIWHCCASRRQAVRLLFGLGVESRKGGFRARADWNRYAAVEQMSFAPPPMR